MSRDGEEKELLSSSGQEFRASPVIFQTVDFEIVGLICPVKKTGSENGTVVHKTFGNGRDLQRNLFL